MDIALDRIRLPFSYAAYRPIARRKFAEVIAKELYRYAIGRRDQQARRYVLERLGRLGHDDGAAPSTARTLWIHANSLGEVYAASGLIRRIREQYPAYRIWVSTGNFSADALAHQVSGADRVIFVPYDLLSVTRAVVRRIRPVALIIVEDVIWPNLVRSCREAGAAIVLVSGRLADGMIFYDRVFTYSEEFFAGIDYFCLQSEEQQRRFAPYLPDPCRAIVTGDLKFGAVDPAEESSLRHWSRRLLGLADHERLWVAGSVHHGEEPAVFDAFAALRRLDPRIVLAIAPRYLEAVPLFEAEAARRGVKTVRRTELDRRARQDEGVVIVDTYGELRRLYACAAWVFLGHSLALPGGGQNLIEPALYAKPILFGPHMRNFQMQADQFLAAGAARQVADGAALSAELVALAGDESRADAMGRRGRALVRQEVDVVGRTLSAVDRYLAGPPAARVSSQASLT